MTTQIAKIHKTLFCLLILFLPTQLGRHFWPDWTMIFGIRTDYLSPTLYFTDLLILGILISWLVEILIVRGRLRRPRTFSKNFSLRSKNKGLIFLFLGFSVFLLANYFFSQNQPAAFYKLVKLIEFIMLGIYIAKNVTIDKLFNCSIVAAIIYSSLIAIAQFIKQGSIGGVFYWLGERSFTGGTPGIAQTIWDGRLLLRSYATFPHPNVLAGFLVVGLLFIISSKGVISSEARDLAKRDGCGLDFSPDEYRGRNDKKPIFYWLVIILGMTALFLTFSHVVWVVFIGAIMVKILLFEARGRELKNFSLRSKKILFVFLFLVFSVFLFSAFPIQPESITYRQDLNLAAIKMWESSPLFGVGLNNFLVRLPEFYQSNGEIRWFQPAHNLFLMVLAETGLIGLIGLIWFLVLTYRRLFNCSIVKLLMPLTAILVLGLFDHYFYTLQQGQILLTMVLGMCWAVTPYGKM